MAVGIDMGFVALELSMAVSAAMNAFAFASHAEGLMISPAIGLGFAVPALVFAVTKTGATISPRALRDCRHPASFSFPLRYFEV